MEIIISGQQRTLSMHLELVFDCELVGKNNLQKSAQGARLKRYTLPILRYSNWTQINSNFIQKHDTHILAAGTCNVS